jgi:chemotaxis protein CheC
MALKLTDLQLDALKEIGTIGAGNTATSLSKMLNRRINIDIPSARVIALEKVPDALGGPEALVAAVYFQITGAFFASFLLIFPLKAALALVDMLLGRKKGETKMLDDIGGSALKEIGNISSGSYLMALSEVTKLKLVHSVPGLATDMLEAVLDGVLIKLALDSKDAVVLDAEFEVEKDTVQGHYLFLPEPEGLDKMLKALNV